MRTRLTRSGPGSRLSVTGEVKPRDLERLRERLLATTPSAGAELQVDVRGVENIGLPLVQLLASAVRSAANSGSRVRLRMESGDPGFGLVRATGLAAELGVETPDTPAEGAS